MSPEREEDSHFDFEILRRFYKVKITPKITLDGTSKSQKKTAKFQNQVLNFELSYNEQTLTKHFNFMLKR